jgi:RNA polymerase sigma-70 factor, ECF subfamily
MAVNRDSARVTQTDDAHRADGAACPSPREDARLVAALHAGRPDAFAELVADYQSAVYNLALRLVRDREDALDVTQDVFLKAYSGIPRTGELHLWAWLYRVTVNACWDHLRAADRRPRPSEDAEELASARSVDDTERAEMARLFSESLAALPPRQQAALVLKDVHGLDHAGIAEALGISPGSSKVLLFHARHSFRRAYTALAADEAQPAACRLAEQTAASSVGRHLNATERRSLLRHARTCPDCRKVMDGWEVPHAVGLALVLPFEAVPHLFGAPAAGALGTALAKAGGATGVATASAGAAAGAAASGGGAAAGAAASAPLLGVTASSGAAAGAAGGIAAKLAGLGAVKAAAIVLAATSVAAYGGTEAYTGHHARTPHRTPVPAASTIAARRPPAAIVMVPATGASPAVASTSAAGGTFAASPARLQAWVRTHLKTSRSLDPAKAQAWRRQWARSTRPAPGQGTHLPGRWPDGRDGRHFAARAGVGTARRDIASREVHAVLRHDPGPAERAVPAQKQLVVRKPDRAVATVVAVVERAKSHAATAVRSSKAERLATSVSAIGTPRAKSLTMKPPAARTGRRAAGGGRAGPRSSGKTPKPQKPATLLKPQNPTSPPKP